MPCCILCLSILLSVSTSVWSLALGEANLTAVLDAHGVRNCLPLWPWVWPEGKTSHTAASMDHCPCHHQPDDHQDSLMAIQSELLAELFPVPLPPPLRLSELSKFSRFPLTDNRHTIQSGFCHYLNQGWGLSHPLRNL